MHVCFLLWPSEKAEGSSADQAEPVELWRHQEGSAKIALPWDGHWHQIKRNGCIPAISVVEVREEDNSTDEEGDQHEDSIHLMEESMLLFVLNEDLPQADRRGAEFSHEENTLEIVPFTCTPKHRHREADGDHDDVMQDHEKFAMKVANSSGEGGILVAFNLCLVPVAEVHGVYVIDEIGHRKEDVAAC